MPAPGGPTRAGGAPLAVELRRSPWLVAALAGFAVMAAAQIAIPLADERAGLTTVVVVGFCWTTGCLAASSWGARRALAALVTVAVTTLAVEAVGHRTGWPFGDYAYSGDLQPQLAGVPVIVPLAWFAMAVPALEVASRLVRSALGRVVLGAVCLTAWDLFLDPQMVDEGYWAWAADGAYRGIPLSNYAGWLAAGAVVMVLLRTLRGAPHRTSTPLLALYTWWAVMQALGFALFFGDALVAAVGAVGMGVPASLAWRAHLARDEP